MGNVRTAIILAAGEALRLRPLTERRAKGMLLVGGKPILQHLVETLATVGIRRVCLVIGHAANGVQSFFKDGRDFGVHVDYVFQGAPTGTADAFRLATASTGIDEPVLVLPGDNFLEKESLAALVEGEDDLLLLARPRHVTRYGVPSIRGERLVGVRDEPVGSLSNLVSTGVLRSSPEMLAFLSRGQGAIPHQLDELLRAYLEHGKIVRVTEAVGNWADITNPWDLLELNEYILRRDASTGQSPRGYPPTTTIAPTARIIQPVHLGEGSSIGDYTVVGPFVSIRNNSIVGNFCEIRRSIINNNVIINSRSTISGSVLDDGVRVGAGFSVAEAATPNGIVGCVLGADADLGHDVRAESGSIVAADEKVPANGRLQREG